MKLPVAAILTVGDELLGGRIINTSAAYLAQRLTERGFLVTATETVGDEEFAIADAIKNLCARADTVVVAGGLGPTPDDVTREALAGVAGVLLVSDRELKAAITRKTGGRAPRRNARQARIPEGAAVFENPLGTAAGLCAEVGGTPVYALPGVPMEMEAIMEASVLADLERRFAGAEPPPLRVLHSFGLREAEVAEKLGKLLERGGEPAVGVTFRAGVVTITVSGDGADRRAEAIHDRLGAYVFGEGEQSLASVVLTGMEARGLTLAVAESLTGGMVSSLLVAQAGASAVLKGCLVPYAPEAKKELLGVPKSVLKREGAASKEVALRMARGARKRLLADVAVATTGVSGPERDAWGTPVGRGFVAVAGPLKRETVKRFQYRGDRNAIRRRFAWTALNQLRLQLGC